MDPSEPAKPDRINTFTLLAVTTLAFSNMLVGLMQNNTFLVLASAGLSAAFALVYSNKIGLIRWWSHDSAAPRNGAAKGQSKGRFPIWLFLTVLFVLMPMVLLFVQQAAS